MKNISIVTVESSNRRLCVYFLFFFTFLLAYSCSLTPLKRLCCCPGDFVECTLLPEGSSFLPFLPSASTHWPLSQWTSLAGTLQINHSCIVPQSLDFIYTALSLSFSLYPISIPQERHRGLEHHTRKLKIPANNSNNDANNNKSMFNKKKSLL